MKNSMFKNKVFRLAELFCGPGGLSYGAVSADISNGTAGPKIKALWANDIDYDTCRTYARNLHPDNPDCVVSGDQRKINFKKLNTFVYCGKVEDINFHSVPSFDVLAFGFPCNDFSLVGEQKGFNGKYGPLYTYGVKALNAHNPDWFVAENVGGIRSANNGHAFAKILEDLEDAGDFGYELTPHLYKFEEYGVPQYRHRVVIIGIRKDIGLKFRVPAPTHLNKYTSVKEALENPPIPPNAPNSETTRQSADVVERLKYIPPGKNAWYNGIPEHLRLNVKGAKMSQIYKRLEADKPSYTITGSGGGGTHVYHWEEPRALTNRERARIQTFRDSFIFEGSKESVRKQIGMAVPVRGATAIVEAVLKTFAGMTYKTIPSNINMEEVKNKKTISKQIVLQIE